VVAFLAAPPLAVALATATTTHLQSVAAEQAAERSLVQAVLLADAPAAEGTGVDGSPATRVPVAAEWSLPGELRQQGTVLADPGTPLGTELPIWVDRDGDVTREPLDRAGIQATATATGVLPLVGVPALACTCYALLCIALDARRDRRWTQEWAAVEPDWSTRSL
jgi:hypothetical protein